MHRHKFNGVIMKSFLFKVSIMSISLILAGCNMLPDISRSSVFIEDIKEQEENQQKRLTQAQISKLIAEWQEMKPAIVDLILLGSALQMVLYQLEQEQQLLQSTVDVQSDIMLQERNNSLNNKEFEFVPKIIEKSVENPPWVAELAEAKLLSSFDEGTDAKLLASFSEPTELKTDNALYSQLPERELQYADVRNLVNSQLQRFDNNSLVREASISDLTSIFEAENGDNKSLTTAQKQEVKLLAEYLVDAKQRDNASEIDAKFVQKKQRDSFSQKNKKFTQKNKGGDVLVAAYANEGFSNNKFGVKANTTPVLIEQKFFLASNPSLIVGKVKDNQAINPKRPQEKSLNCRQLNASIGSGYALHLASYSKQSSAKVGWLDLVENSNASLCHLTPALKEVYVNGKQFFSLRAGGFESKAKADDACAEIAKTKQYCKSTRFDGIPL
jgi:hypothetical protein